MTAPHVPHPRQWYCVLVLALAAGALTRCASEPLPAPPMPPPHVGLAPKQDHRLQAIYDTAAARLHAYRALPPCAASGPLVCFDPVQAREVSQLAHAARMTLHRAQRAGASVKLARARVGAFAAAANKLPAAAERHLR